MVHNAKKEIVEKIGIRRTIIIIDVIIVDLVILLYLLLLLLLLYIIFIVEREVIKEVRVGISEVCYIFNNNSNYNNNNNYL